MKTEKLARMTTVEEVLETVAEFDREAHSFYTDLVPKVSKNIRWLVEELARSELDHIQRLRGLVRSDSLRGHLKDAIHRPEADRRFSDAIQAPELGDDPDDQAVLQYALARVQIAIEEYAELAAEVPSGPMHEVFAFLANEETRHKTELEALYYEIVHAGGV